MKRILALLKRMELDKSFSKELADFQEELLQAGVEAEEAYDYARDFESSLADEYLLLSGGIYSAILTALYHLWERDIKDFCKHMLRYYPVAGQKNKIVTEQNIQEYNYDKLKSLLIFWGAEETIFPEVNLLRLIVNTIKHGSGPSAIELVKSNNKYYRMLALLCDLDLNLLNNSFGEAEILDIDDVKYFGTVLSSFWAELGKTISI
ncbi:MAG: hypothetical protein Q7J31_16510 [Syntrophales bacterium]|nr:hypothetical protein [Syntrophales bacterium]